MKLKICGLQTLQDIDYINQARVDYAGFVFTPHRQQISIETAKTLKKALHPQIKSVGVFTEESYDYIKHIVDEGIVDLVQFHGTITYDLPCQRIQAFRMQSQNNAQGESDRGRIDIATIGKTDCDFVLFDAYSADTKGASGRSFDWHLIEGYNEKPFFLAGGIHAGNIKRALQQNPNAYAIDIASGVEENGKKSFQKIQEVAHECKVW